MLGPLLFLCHINDLPDRAKFSFVRLFADDCLLYRTIRNIDDQLALQEDLRQLEIWASDWGMSFNAAKCYILSINSRQSFYYQLNGTILKHVDNNPYLGLLISKDLKWATHIEKTTKKASSTLGFIQRNLRRCPQNCRKTAYIALNLCDPHWNMVRSSGIHTSRKTLIGSRKSSGKQLDSSHRTTGHVTLVQ